MGCRLSQNSVEKEFTQVVDIYYISTMLTHRGWEVTNSTMLIATQGVGNLNHSHTGGGHLTHAHTHGCMLTIFTIQFKNTYMYVKHVL